MYVAPSQKKKSLTVISGESCEVVRVGIIRLPILQVRELRFRGLHPTCH